MSDEPAGWLSRVADELGIGTGLPPEAIIVAAVEAASPPYGRDFGPAVEELREDIRSYSESSPYFIRRDERGDPVRCECCGTPVALTTEALGLRGPWKPGIWEHETFRRHTLRRCEWKRANA